MVIRTVHSHRQLLRMNPVRYNGLIILLGMGLLFGNSARAEPLTALFTLLIAERITSSAEPAPAPQARPVAGWREQLAADELATLETLRQHPAIGVCMEKADQHHPIASYHVRKMARFSTAVQRHLERTGSLPDIESLQYQWPARAFRWCGEQAGVAVSSAQTSLLTYAYNMARVVHFHHNQSGMVALNQ